MRVAIADDSALFRQGLARLLEAIGVSVVTEAKTAEELESGIKHDVPDVVVLDIRMPPTFTDEGLIAASNVRKVYPHVGIILLSTHVEPSAAEHVFTPPLRGVGYLLKDRVTDVASLRDALERVAEGGVVLDSDVAAALLSNRAARSSIEKLTDRERTVLGRVTEGLSNSGIAAALNLSERTVENHIARLLAKLGIDTDLDYNRRVLAVLLALRFNQSSSDPPLH